MNNKKELLRGLWVSLKHRGGGACGSNSFSN